mgnify:CR=1 FL=1
MTAMLTRDIVVLVGEETTSGTTATNSTTASALPRPPAGSAP